MIGSDEPVKLFTIDVDPNQIQYEEETEEKTFKQIKIARVNQRIIRNNMREAANRNELHISDFFETNTDIALMMKPFGKVWRDTYNAGFAEYLKGNWPEAMILFNRILEMKPDDKPTLNLVEYIQDNKMKAPAGWKGHKYFGE